MKQDVVYVSVLVLSCAWLIGCEPDQGPDTEDSESSADAKLQAATPQAAKAGAAEAGAAKPEGAAPGAAPPESAKPESAEPESAEPESAKLESAKPEAARPEAAGQPIVTETVVEAVVAPPTVDELDAEWSRSGKEHELYVKVEMSGLDPAEGGARPVLVAACQDGEVERLALVRHVAPQAKETSAKVSDGVLFESKLAPCRIQVLLPAAEPGKATVLKDQCVGAGELCTGPVATAATRAYEEGAVVSADAPSWARYTGARPHGWDVSLDVELEVKQAFGGLGRIQAFAACEGAEEEELSFDDDEVAYLDDLAWVAAGQRFRVRGSTVAYLDQRGKGCSVRVTARPEEGEAVELVRWCLDGKKARPGACG